MAAKLTPEEIVTLQVRRDKGQSNTQIAQTLGVSEGTVRYHARRHGHADGRQGKPRKADVLGEVIDHWVPSQQPEGPAAEPRRPVNVRALFDGLRGEHASGGSYKSVLRFVRARYPQPRLRPFRRVATPPGAQAQVDWGEFPGLDIGDGPQVLYGFVRVLSPSRRETLIGCRCMDQLAWHHAHTEAFRRLGGIPALLRIDNRKTGVGPGAGPWGEVNAAYRSYARGLGFPIDACLPRCPEDKGKVENKVGVLKRRLRRAGRWFDSLAALQAWTDEERACGAEQRLGPATGETGAASWRAEPARLRPLPALLPLAFATAVTRPVPRDGTVSFAGRTSSVPFVLCGLTVAVRGGAAVVQVLHAGPVVAEHPRHRRQRLLLDPAHYEGCGDDRVAPPVPLGRLGPRWQAILAQEVEQRPLDLYAALAAVAR